MGIQQYRKNVNLSAQTAVSTDVLSLEIELGEYNFGNGGIASVIPPAGKVMNLRDIQFVIPAPVGATTGTRELLMSSLGSGTQLFCLQWTASYDEDMKYFCGEFSDVGNGDRSPQSSAIFSENIRAVELTAPRTFYVTFKNKTDVDMVGKKILIRLAYTYTQITA